MRKNNADLHLQIPAELRQKLEEEAFKKGLNLSNLVRLILIESFKKE